MGFGVDVSNGSEIESEIEDDNTEDGYLIIDEQDKHQISEDLYFGYQQTRQA